MSREWGSYGGEKMFILGFGGKSEGERPLSDLALDGDNTKMDLQDVC